MVFMALDHVRDFVTNQRVQPERLAQHGSAALFFTRWVTHFCAPAFALLAGVGIGLMMERGSSRAETSRFLLIRGLWLVVLDLIITPVGWRFSFDSLPAFALVLWSLGLSMIVMAGLIYLPRVLVAVLSVVMIAGHNLFDGVSPDAWGSFAWLWHVLHVPGFAIPNVLLIAYPLIPWVAVMAVGWTLTPMIRNSRFLIATGAATTALFLIVRSVNHYGNPFPWTHMPTAGLTVASFLNVMKYPPSLDFLLMTLGPVLTALALLDRARGPVAEFFSVYGRVPMFYYVVHIAVVHAVGVAIAFAQSGTIMRIPAVVNPDAIPAWYGVGLPGVYASWILVVVLMYPLCRWYMRLKATGDYPWMRYL